jgi:hypothetical protein
MITVVDERGVAAWKTTCEMSMPYHSLEILSRKMTIPPFQDIVGDYCR